MPYWEYELFREKANEVIEEENKQQEEGKNNNKYTKDVDRYMHNMPSYSRLSGDEPGVGQFGLASLRDHNRRLGRPSGAADCADAQSIRC